MTAITFPATPTVGAKHTVGTRAWVWDGGKWNLDIAAPPAVLPGLGGWADITATTGSPTKHPYTDANGQAWVAYQWTGNGSVTTTDGLVDLLMIGAGACRGGSSTVIGGSGGRLVTGLRKVTATTNTVTVAPPNTTGGASLPSLFGSESTGVMVYPLGDAPALNHGAGGTVANPKLGAQSSITGTVVTYGAAEDPSNFGGGASAGMNPLVGGVVIVRVPAVNAKA
jgi:hypothetical protein